MIRLPTPRLRAVTNERARLLLQPYVGWRRSEDDGWAYSLVGDISVLAQDQTALSALGAAGRRRGFLADGIDTGFMPRLSGILTGNGGLTLVDDKARGQWPASRLLAHP
jgi:hypothetical protein